MNEIMKGESIIILPNEVSAEFLETIAGELLNEIINLDVTNNAAKKMYAVSEIVEDIFTRSGVSNVLRVYISDYAGNYEIYRTAQHIKHALNTILNKSSDNMTEVAKWLCERWTSLLIINNQDICKETISMILDVREGKNFYFIIKK